MPLPVCRPELARFRAHSVRLDARDSGRVGIRSVSVVMSRNSMPEDSNRGNPRAYDAFATRSARRASTRPSRSVAGVRQFHVQDHYPLTSCVCRGRLGRGRLRDRARRTGARRTDRPDAWMSELTMSPRGHVLTSVIAGRHHGLQGRRTEYCRSRTSRRSRPRRSPVHAEGPHSPTAVHVRYQVRRHWHGRAGGVDCGRRGPEGRLG